MAKIPVNPGISDSKMIYAGEYLEMTSEYFPDLAAPRAEYCPALADLKTKHTGKLAAATALRPIGIRVKFQELVVQGWIGRLAVALQGVDGGRRGATFEAVMPEGKTPEVKPQGEAQLTAVDLLLNRATTRGLNL